MGARQRDEGRNQDQESPYVGERITHDDQSGTIKHNLENYRDHELQVRDRQGWTGVDGLSVARDVLNGSVTRDVLSFTEAQGAKVALEFGVRDK